MFDLSDPVVAFRMGERLTLTAIVIVVALVVMVGFWRSVQRVEISDASKLGLGGSVMFSTPVFVLLAIVGYAWVSLSNPIEVARAAPAPPAPAAADDASGTVATAGPGPDRFLGSAWHDPEKAATPYERQVAQRRIRTLNCLAKAAGGMPPGQEDDVIDAKLLLMAPVWTEDWGDARAFADWARGTAGGPPDAEAAAVFGDRHPMC